MADPSCDEKRLKGTELVWRALLFHGNTNAELLESASATATFKRAFPGFTDYRNGTSRDRTEFRGTSSKISSKEAIFLDSFA